MLPSFKREFTNCYETPELMRDVAIENHSGKSFSVSNLFQCTDICLNMPTELNRNNFTIDPDEDSIIIRKSFIIALINVDILTEFNIPIVSVSVVTEKDFIYHK
jgi:hypothetical protein